MSPLSHLALVARLLDVARAGTLFPDPRGVMEWVLLLGKPWAGRAVPRLELHPVAGLPTRRSLERLLHRQRLARAFFAAHRARPRRGTDQFNAALAAAELWAPRTEAKVMSAERTQSRLLVLHDRFDARTGTLVRFSVQLQAKGSRHVKLALGTRCTPTGPFVEAVEQACDGSATACAVRLHALEGVTVHEVVRAELGPCVSALNADAHGPLAELARGDQAVLSLQLERVGDTVSEDHLADAWPGEDPHAAGRAAHGWKRARERKLICTPPLETPLKALAAQSRMLVRSR